MSHCLTSRPTGTPTPTHAARPWRSRRCLPPTARHWRRSPAAACARVRCGRPASGAPASSATCPACERAWEGRCGWATIHGNNSVARKQQRFRTKGGVQPLYRHLMIPPPPPAPPMTPFLQRQVPGSRPVFVYHRWAARSHRRLAAREGQRGRGCGPERQPPRVPPVRRPYSSEPICFMLLPQVDNLVQANLLAAEALSAQRDCIAGGQVGSRAQPGTAAVACLVLHSTAPSPCSWQAYFVHDDNPGVTSRVNQVGSCCWDGGRCGGRRQRRICGGTLQPSFSPALRPAPPAV